MRPIESLIIQSKVWESSSTTLQKHDDFLVYSSYLMMIVSGEEGTWMIREESDIRLAFSSSATNDC